MACSQDPAPLSPRQLHAVATAAARELGWGLRAVKNEHARWTRRAARIADPDRRRHALAALADKRPLLDGAALFWTIPDRRDRHLLRTLVAFQVLANYHDHASERAGAGHAVEGAPGSSMDSFVQAVDLGQPPSAYRDDPYLAALVGTCRRGCARLPRYAEARDHLVRATRQGRSLDLEHVADRAEQRALLRSFAEREFNPQPRLTWFELTAGASSMLTAIVSLALADRADVTHRDLHEAVEAYTLVASLSALLDNYVDLREDAASGSHNYLAYYATVEHAVARLGDLIVEALGAAGHLRWGDRHRVIVASMIAMYLTADGAREAKKPAESTRRLAQRGGSLVAVLMPTLKTWRKTRGDGSA